MTPASKELMNAPEEPPSSDCDSSSRSDTSVEPVTDSPIEVAAELSVEIRCDDCLPQSAEQRSGSPHANELVRGVQIAAGLLGFRRGNIDVLITDDASIRTINRTHLNHDYATDVISFGYEIDGDFVSGEMVVSVDTAADRAREQDVAPDTELLLYVIHGTLHICGMDDKRNDDRARMRIAERQCLSRLNAFDWERLGPDWQSTGSGGSATRTTELAGQSIQSCSQTDSGASS